LILTRYIIREIRSPMVAICVLLIVVFGSYSAAQYLADAVGGLLPPGAVILLIMLKIAIALEVLLPTTLYLSVVISLGRMYRDSEMIALESCGVGISRILKSVFYYAAIVAFLVAGLSCYVRPWAYERIYWWKAQAKSNFDISRIEAGHFYELQEGDLVIFAGKVKRARNRGENVFLRSKDAERLQVIYAKRAYQGVEETSGNQVLLLQDGYLYEFALNGGKGNVTEFQKATYVLVPKKIIPDKYRRKAAPTSLLVRSDNLEDIAEMQWRFSTPISAILLGLLGVALSRTTPRKGKYGKLVTAVLVFAVYYNVSIVAKNWVEKGTVSPIPGMWWVPALLAALIVAMFWHQIIVVFKRLGR
jgi:lipopolysaccharide export system permease protein